MVDMLIIAMGMDMLLLATDMDTSDFIWKVIGVYTHSMETVYLYLVPTGYWGNIFITSRVFNFLTLKQKLQKVSNLVVWIKETFSLEK